MNNRCSARTSKSNNYKVRYSFCITDHIQKGEKINHLFTSSWIFFSFSFCSELETGFDLLPSKLMYKPPSSFSLMPGSIRLDISFLKQIGTENIPQEEQSCLISHLCTQLEYIIMSFTVYIYTQFLKSGDIFIYKIKDEWIPLISTFCVAEACVTLLHVILR